MFYKVLKHFCQIALCNIYIGTVVHSVKMEEEKKPETAATANTE
jgi:hypothetical protein